MTELQAIYSVAGDLIIFEQYFWKLTSDRLLCDTFANYLPMNF